MNKIRVFEAFSGIGAQAMALKRLQANYPDVVEFEFVGTSEIESNAIKAYNAVHGDVKCYGDITKIDWSEVPDFDLFTMSSPCQDFSVAGRQAGAEEGSGTRSSLLWECRKAIIAKRPKYILFENVSAVVSKKFIRGFNKWQSELESYGYTNFAKILNSKDFGIPQHRERLFMVSIWGGHSYHFPEPFKLEKRIKDILEPYGTVDESFYFSAKQLSGMFKYCDRKKDEGCGFQTNFRTEDSIATCVTSRYGAEYTNTYLREPALFNPMDDGTARTIKAQYARVGPANCIRQDGYGASCVIEPALQQRLSLYGNNAQAGRVYDVGGIAPCLDTCCGGNRMPKIMESVDRQSKIRSKVMPNGNIRFYQDDESKSGISEMQIIHEDNICPTVTTAHIPKILTSVRSEEMKELRKKGIERFSGRVNVPREDGICNTITTVTKDYLLQEPCILGYTRDDNGKVCDRHDKEIANTVHTSTGSGGNTDQFVKEPMVGNAPRRIFGKDDFRSDVCGALMAVDYKSPKLVKEPIELSFDNLPNKTVLKDEDGKGYLWQDGGLWRVRKLVPIEVFRLQDVSDEDAKKIIAVCSKSVCYQLAGNSITCAVLYHIFRKLWIDTENESTQKSLFDL